MQMAHKFDEAMNHEHSEVAHLQDVAVRCREQAEEERSMACDLCSQLQEKSMAAEAEEQQHAWHEQEEQAQMQKHQGQRA